MSFSNEPIVSIDNASIFQDHATVLSEITFDISKGEFIYLVGRTGSGKSSLLKTLYGDLPLRLGDIKIVGYDIRGLKASDVPFLRRKIGIIFQDFELFYDRSVADNLYFVMQATGWKDKAKMKSRIAEVLMKVGLGSVTSKMPHQLSGGEQQRIVIARALINEPQILFADEPTGNLDPEVADGIMKLFLEINNSGTAVVMATHNHHFLSKYEARVIKCDAGKIKDSKVEQFELTSLY